MIIAKASSFLDKIVAGGRSRCYGEVPCGEQMLYSGTDPESYITEHTLVYENKAWATCPIHLQNQVVRI